MAWVPDSGAADAAGSAACAGRPVVVLTQDAAGAADWRAQLDGLGIASLHWPAFEVHPEPDARVLAVFDMLGACGGRSDGMPGVSGASGASDALDVRDVRDVTDAPGIPGMSGGLDRDVVVSASTPVPADAGAPCQAVIMPSPAAVRLVLGALQRAGRSWPRHVLAALPGAGSARAFASCMAAMRPGLEGEVPRDGEGWPEALEIQMAHPGAPRDREVRRLAGQPISVVVPPPPAQDGAHLAQCLLQHRPRVGAVHVLGRPDGRRDWAGGLQASGVVVSFHTVYRVEPRAAVPGDFGAALGRLRAEGAALHWIGGAASVLRVLSGWMQALPADLGAWARRQTVWVPHPRLLDVARETGLGKGRVYHDRQSLIERLQSAMCD